MISWFWKRLGYLRNWRLVPTFFRNSRLVALIAGIVSLFWYVESLRDEFLPVAKAEKLRLVDLLPHWSLATWGCVVLAFVFFSLIEGALVWYGNEVEPTIGAVGSLQHDAALIAARVGEFTRVYVQSHEFPREEGDRSLERKWRWESQFSAAFQAELRDDVKRVLQRLAAKRLTDPEVDQLISLATINPTIALHAASLLFRMSLLVPQVNAVS